MIGVGYVDSIDRIQLVVSAFLSKIDSRAQSTHRVNLVACLHLLESVLVKFVQCGYQARFCLEVCTVGCVTVETSSKVYSGTCKSVSSLCKTKNIH